MNDKFQSYLDGGEKPFAFLNKKTKPQLVRMVRDYLRKIHALQEERNHLRAEKEKLEEKMMKMHLVCSDWKCKFDEARRISEEMRVSAMPFPWEKDAAQT